MTSTLITIVVFFLIGEVPGHLLSKKAAAIMLFGGSEDGTFDKSFVTARKVAAVLAAVNCSSNFILYFIMHPPFRSGFKELICGGEKVSENVETAEKKEEDHNNIEIFVVSNSKRLSISLFREKMKFLSSLFSWKN